MKKTIKKELEALAKMPDEAIDTSDIAELTDWRSSVRGKFYRPIKRRVTIRLDADVIEWFKRKNPRYQTAINEALRHYIKSGGHCGCR